MACPFRRSMRAIIVFLSIALLTALSVSPLSFAASAGVNSSVSRSRIVSGRGLPATQSFPDIALELGWYTQRVEAAAVEGIVKRAAGRIALALKAERRRLR